MADQKISELTEKTTPVADDLLAIVDSEAEPIETKKLKHSNLKIPKIIDADGDTQIQVEESADEDKIRMDVEGVEAFLLSDVGELTLAKQSGCAVSRSATPQVLLDAGFSHIAFDVEGFDIQNEFDSSSLTGSATATTANHLIDTTKNQFTAADVGKTVWNTTDNTYTTVTVYNSTSDLTLAANIMASGEGYILFFSRFTAKEAGLYLATTLISVSALVDGQRLIAYIKKNNADVAVSMFTVGSANDSGVLAITIVNLAIDDYLNVYCYQNAGAVKPTVGIAGMTTFAVAKIA